MIPPFCDKCHFILIGVDGLSQHTLFTLERESKHDFLQPLREHADAEQKGEN